MGELAKKIGEHGEKVALSFFECIGWKSPSDGESVPCSDRINHERKKDSLRDTHGIDLFYSYKSNLEDFSLENVLISVKFTTKPYDTSPASKFKSHFKDLAQTTKCFLKSSLRDENNKGYEFSGIRKANDLGVLFWITTNRECDQDIVSKVSNVLLDKSLDFGNIQIVDCARASFIYNSIKFAKNLRENSNVYFHYAFSSSNYTDPDIKKYGEIFPVEYITAPFIPMRIIDNDSKTQIFCISSKESFSDMAMKRLMNFASDVSQDFTSEFVFLFPQYDEIENKASVNTAIRLLGERSSHIKVSVYSYKDDFRGLINE